MEEKKKNSSKKTIYTILMMICIMVFLFSLYNVIKILNEYNEIDEYYEETQDQFAVVEEGILTFIDFAKIRGVNQDVVAWINIEDTNISYPVLQGKDNDYYLYRNYEKKYLGAGSIFLDAANNSNFSDLHTVVYGHNMKNGSMFGSLDKFKSETYRNEHPYVYMLFPDGKWYKYEIYSYYTADINDGTFQIFASGAKLYSDYVSLTTKKNVYKNVDAPANGERILTLSTCTEDSNDFKRNVLHAKYLGAVEGIE